MSDLTTEKLRQFDLELDTLRAAFATRPATRIHAASSCWHRACGATGGRGATSWRPGRDSTRSSSGVDSCRPVRASGRPARPPRSRGASVTRGGPGARQAGAGGGGGDRRPAGATRRPQPDRRRGKPLDDFESSERHLLRSIDHAEGLGHDLALTAVTNLAVTYLMAGRYDEARVRCSRSSSIASGSAQVEGVAFAHPNLGEVEFEAGRMDEAEGHFVAALEAFGAVGFQVADREHPARTSPRSRRGPDAPERAARQARAGGGDARRDRLGRGRDVARRTGDRGGPGPRSATSVRAAVPRRCLVVRDLSRRWARGRRWPSPARAGRRSRRCRRASRGRRTGARARPAPPR